MFLQIPDSFSISQIHQVPRKNNPELYSLETPNDQCLKINPRRLSKQDRLSRN